MIIDVKPVQPLKALAPTLVTLSGIFIVERVVQSLNALAAMPVIEKLLPLVTDVGIVTLFAHELAATITLYLLITAYRMLFLVKHSPLLLKSTVSLFTVTDVNPVQFAKALFPTLVTLYGIVIDDSPVQPLNASLPMLVIPGIVTDVSSVQFLNASLSMLATEKVYPQCSTVGLIVTLPEYDFAATATVFLLSTL